MLEPLAREVGGRALAVDLADPKAIDGLLVDAGDVEIVIANAALPSAGLLTTFSPQDIDRALDVNLRAPIIMARHYAEVLGAKGAGHLVFISSISGKVGSSYSSMYNASKFGLRGFGAQRRWNQHPR